jgi:hypothetical protein
MLSRFRHVFGIVFFLLVASCSGGGCSGCGGCGGTTPLPGGFPKDKAIENAASVRVSRPGLDFVEKSLPAIATQVAGATDGKLFFDIPEVDPPKTQIANLGIGRLLIDPKVCPGGPDPDATPPRCQAEVGIGQSTFVLDAVTPGAIRVRATIPLKLEDTPVNAAIRANPIVGPEFGLGSITLHIGYGNGGCSNGKPNVTAKALPVGVTIPLVAETTSPRDGYTKIDVENAEIDLSGLSESDVKVCSSCGFATDVCSAITNSNFVKGLAVSPLKSGLEAQVRGMLREQLCTAPNPTLNPSCPTGSKPDADNKHCVYNSAPDKCVSMLLGSDAHVELGGFLRAISPSSQGGLDFGLAAGGAMNPAPGEPPNAQGRTPNGITLAMIGGVLPQPPSKCVPDWDKDIPIPRGIPVPDELAPAQADNDKTPHVGLALAGRFLDYSLASVYRSGLLCLGVSSEQIEMLKSGLLSLIIPSIKTLTFEQADAAAAIATRPQAPPTVVVGGGTDPDDDPLLLVTLPKFAVDFYIWSHDRFVRAFTFQADLSIPVSLQTGKDGIAPALGGIKVANGEVMNAELLSDDPALIAGALSELLGGLSKQFLGNGFSPIDVSSALSSFGMGLEVNDIKKLSKGSDDFVGLFATFSDKGGSGAALAEADTRATLVGKTVPQERMQLETISREATPELIVDVGSPLDDGQRPVEYTWWIDRGTRAPWARTNRLVIRDAQLLLQGRHVLHVAARLAGEASTEDATPAQIPFVIDALPPFVTVSRNGTKASVEAWDLVSESSELVGRYAFDESEMSAWMPLAELAELDATGRTFLDVEVKDEEGNVRSVRQELRGRADGTLAGDAACGCSAPGSSDKGGLAAVLVALAGLGFVVLRRRGGLSFGARLAPSRTAALAVVTIGAVAATTQGCGCGSEAESGPRCGADCNQECKPDLSPGMPGSYTSVAKAEDGTIWVAGYNDALLEEGDAMLWGDLVVGRYDLGKETVDWVTVDGIPERSEGCAERDPSSWRRGESDSGDNVGLWTSIQISAEGRPLVSYYDVTNKRLKLAFEDGGWQSFVLREAAGADIGRYSKMRIVDGKPVVAYQHVEAGDGGFMRGKIVLARARTAVPRSADDFDFEDVAVDEQGPCRADSCGGGSACVKSTGACTQTVSGCEPACGASEACVSIDEAATCVAVQGAVGTYPRAIGGYLSLADGPRGLGIAAYDAFRGNLVAYHLEGGSWKATILDGEAGSRADGTALDTGDVGVGTSLAIDGSGTWHVSYVNGLDETLRYVTFDGQKAGRSEIVDDGTEADGSAHQDGKHLVGDDSALRADGDVIVIYYQDATVGTLRRATGTRSGTTRSWDLRALPQPNRFGGFFPQIIPGEDRVANWWRQTDRSTKSVVGNVSILSP